MTAGGASTRRAKRSCDQCYHRKVRCQGRFPECQPCQRLGFACSFASSSATASPNQPRKLRGGNACLPCRKQKSRCNEALPQCSHCAKKKWTCTYASAVHTSPATPIPTGDEPPNLAPDGPPLLQNSEAQASYRPDPVADVEQSVADVQNESLPGIPPSLQADTMTGKLVADFFDIFYPVPSFSFLHPRTTLERLADGSLDEALLLAICGIAISRRRLEPAATGQSIAWISRSEELVWQQLESPSMARLQALIICVAYRIDSGSSHRAFMLAGFAARAAAAMRLNHERHDLDPVSNEVRRRTLWSLKVLELYFSIGLPEYELLSFENVYLQLPSREEQFQDSSPSLHLEGGAYSLYVRLLSIRRDIMKLNRSIALCDQPFPQLLKLIRSFDNELNHLQDQMPAPSQMTAASVVPFVSTPWLARHLVMQLSWHQCRGDLYRLLLPGYPEAAPAVVLSDFDMDTTENAIHHCSKSALSMIEIISEVNTHCSHSPVLEYDAAICGYHACRLILFLAHAQPGNSGLSKEYAVSRADLCLVAIRRFFRHSAPVEPIVRDLERLISTCSTSSDDRTQLIFRTPPMGHGRDLPLSEVAKAQQRLAIHSLLRQAEFDNGEPPAVVSPASTNTEPSATRSRNMFNVLSLGNNPRLRSGWAGGSVQQPGMEVEQANPPGAVSTLFTQPLLFPWGAEQHFYGEVDAANSSEDP